MSSPFKLLCLPSVQSFMMVYRLSFQCLYLCLQLLAFNLFFLLLSLGPLKNSASLLTVLGKLGLLFFIVFVSLTVLNLELGYVVSSFVFVVFKVQLNDRTVPDGQILSFFHPFKGFNLKRSFLLAVYLLRLTFLLLLKRLYLLWLLRQHVSSPQVQRPLLIVVSLIAYLYTSKQFRKCTQQVLLQLIVEF